MTPRQTPALSDALEDYLEAIYHLVEEHKVARALQVSRRLGVSKSSVTGALNALAEQGLINYEPYQVITLTRRGSRLARKIDRRHRALKAFFEDILDVPEAEAGDLACRLEHAIRGDVFERFLRFVEFLQACPRFSLEWEGGFKEGCGEGDPAEYEAYLLDWKARIENQLTELHTQENAHG